MVEPQKGQTIAGVERALDVLTYCLVVLHNGFTATGASACASQENFDAEIGRKIARQNAVAKIGPLLGFRLRDQIACGNAAQAISGFSAHDIADAHRDSFAAGQASAEQEPGTWLDRVKHERATLYDRLTSLQRTLRGDRLPAISASQWKLMHSQERSMSGYLEILQSRIEDAQLASQAERA